MEIKRVKEYENPKFSTFQLKTGKILVAGVACLALLGASSTLQGCAGMMIAPDYTEEAPSEPNPESIGSKGIDMELPPATPPEQQYEIPPTEFLAGNMTVFVP